MIGDGIGEILEKAALDERVKGSVAEIDAKTCLFVRRDISVDVNPRDQSDVNLLRVRKERA